MSVKRTMARRVRHGGKWRRSAPHGASYVNLRANAGVGNAAHGRYVAKGATTMPRGDLAHAGDTTDHLAATVMNLLPSFGTRLIEEPLPQRCSETTEDANADRPDA